MQPWQQQNDDHRLASAIDNFLSSRPGKRTGFILITHEFNSDRGEARIYSNCSHRADIAALLKEVATHFEDGSESDTSNVVSLR
jgi:hypothetical protein